MDICVEQRIEKALRLSLGFLQVDAAEKLVDPFLCWFKETVLLLVLVHSSVIK